MKELISMMLFKIGGREAEAETYWRDKCGGGRGKQAWYGWAPWWDHNAKVSIADIVSGKET